MPDKKTRADSIFPVAIGTVVLLGAGAAGAGAAVAPERCAQRERDQRRDHRENDYADGVHAKIR